MKLRKRFTVLVLSLLLFFPFLVPVKVQAAEKKFLGTVLNDSVTVTTNVTKENLSHYKYVKTLTRVSGDSDIYLLGFSWRHVVEGGGGNAYFTALAYSTSQFKIKEKTFFTMYSHEPEKEQTYDHGTYERSAEKDAASGLYYYRFDMGISGSAELFETTGCGVPTYNIDVYMDLLLPVLSEIANGTFEKNHDDDFVDGSDLPEFDGENADYRKGLGYLKNIHRSNLSIKEAYPEDDPNLGGLSHMEYSYRYKYDSKSTTDFDLKTAKTYIRVYASIAVYDGRGNGKNVLNDMPRRFVTQYKASDLSFTVKQSDVDKVMGDLLEKIDTPSFTVQSLLNNYVRDDTLWFQIIHYNGTSWEYGGYAKYVHTKDGQGKKEDYKPDDTKDDNSKDEIDDQDEGEGDSEDEAIEDAEDDDFEFTDFDSILESLSTSIGQIPQLIGKVFSFLPREFIAMLVSGIAVVVICRIFGR